MTTIQKIQELTKSNLVSSKKLAEKLGLSKAQFWQKSKGNYPFSELEIKEIDRIYQILKQI
jgi:hypothetical protein